MNIFKFTEEVRQVFSNPLFSLPQPKTEDFKKSLNELLKYYVKDCMLAGLDNSEIELIKKICLSINMTIENYYNGLPYQAFTSMVEGLVILSRKPLSYKTPYTFGARQMDRSEKMFRVRDASISESEQITRAKMFHIPFDQREKVHGYRYSIVGYPSLYLGSSVSLCCRESRYTNGSSFFASEFQLTSEDTVNLFVLDLSVTPSYLLNQVNSLSGMEFDKSIIEKYRHYFLWYPLIASCSFVRQFESEFRPEYIVPQILMQWLRTIYEKKDTPKNRLIAISYISCFSEDPFPGTNYVFPTSGKQYSNELKYCVKLVKAFKVSVPETMDFFETSDFSMFKGHSFKSINF